jgi:VanZ family protein
VALAGAVLCMSGPWGSTASTASRVLPLLEALGLSPAGAAAVHAAGRTAGHLVAYALVAVLALRAVRGDAPATAPRAAAAFLLAVALSVADESLQASTHGRGGRLRDVLVDGTGALLGVAWALRRARRALVARGSPDGPVVATDA